MSQKIVINRCWGGFSLSRKAMLRLRELGDKTALEETDFGEVWKGDPNHEVRKEQAWSGFCRDIPRNDPLLIQVIEEMGVNAASAQLAKLAIVKIPDGVEWVIDEYDGMEQVQEAHRSWA